MAANELCRICASADGDIHWIACDKCDHWFHGCCAGLTSSGINSIASFYCEECTRRDPTLSTRLNAPDFNRLRKPELQNELIARHLDPQGGKAALLRRLNEFEQARAQNLALPFITHSRNQVLKRIPKVSRHSAAARFAQLLECVLRNPTSVLAWRRLFAFAPVCLRKRNPDDTSTKNTSLTALVNRQIRDFDRSWHEPLPKPKTKKKATKKPRNATISDRVSSKISDGDVKGAVRIASSDDSMAPFTRETADLLREKHPARNPNSTLPPGPDANLLAPLVVDQSDVRKAILSFPASSSGGPDGLRPQHLKDMIGKAVGEPGTRLLNALMDFSNLCLRGELPDSVAVFALSLLAIRCDVWLEKCVVNVATRELQDYFKPVQIWCGAPKGAESVAHAAFDFMAGSEAETVLLKIDFRNAFNCIRRDVVLTCARDKMPALYPFVWQSYSADSHLYFMDDVILSQEGMQQGDAMGPVLFSLGIHDMIQNLSSVFNAWYLDDGTIGGDVESVLTDFRRIVTASAELGLEINDAKCELIVLNAEDDRATQIHDSFKQIAPNIRLMGLAEATLLGTAISEEAVEGVLRSKLEELRRLSTRLLDIDAHDALFLLRHCFALPKLLYILRSCPTFECPVLSDYDDLLRSTLESILNTKYDERSWCQASLPVVYGGLGIRRASALSLPAFLASSYGCEGTIAQILPDDFQGKRDVLLQRALEHWTGLSGGSNEPSVRSRLKDWDNPISATRLWMLHASASSDEERARLHAVSSPCAGAWLNALPAAPLGLKMDDTQIRIACGLRTGSELCFPHRCSGCSAEVSALGTHGLSCKKSAGRLVRHNHVNDLIRRACVSAGATAILEPPGICRSDGKRPDGITLVPWSQGRQLVWDFTCKDTVAPSLIHMSSTGASKVAAEGERAKSAKYAELDRSYSFRPVCVETLGAWGPSAMTLVKEIGARVQANTCEPRSTSFLIQAVSMAVQRGNVASVLGTLPCGKHLDEVFDL